MKSLMPAMRTWEAARRAGQGVMVYLVLFLWYLGDNGKGGWVSW